MLSLLHLHILLSVLFCFISLRANPQSGYASKKEAAIIKATELIVIIDDNASDYNTAIKAAIEKYWTFSPFRFVTESKKYEFCSEGYTLLDKHRIDVYSSVMYYISVLLPDKNGCRWEKRDMMAYSYASFDAEKIKGDIIRSIQFIQNYLNIVLLKGGNDSGFFSICNLCNKEMKSVKDKLLLINNSDVEKGLDDSTKIARYYKHPFKMTGRIDLCHAMEEQKINVAYLMYFVDAKEHVYRLVVQAKDSKIIYCDKEFPEAKPLFYKNNFRALSR